MQELRLRGRGVDVRPILEAIAGSDVQRIQTQFRARIVDSWAIPPGARVLEIGCGQGDMTAVLAEAVGPSGRVTAIDVATPEYGSPETIEVATNRLRQSYLGARITFRLACDLLEAPQLGMFDFVIFAHSAWYFDSEERLAKTLVAARGYADTLCLSEWDPRPRRIEHLGHFLAVQIQGIVAALEPDNVGNVQTPVSRTTMMRLIQRAGWTIEQEAELSDPDLQDGRWEVALALSLNPIGPDRLKTLLQGQLELLGDIDEIQPLDSYSVRAVK